VSRSIARSPAAAGRSSTGASAGPCPPSGGHRPAAGLAGAKDVDGAVAGQQLQERSEPAAGRDCIGLDVEPWASERQTPLSHSFCQYAVASREPLVVSDAREHPVLKDDLAIRDLGVIAYLGIPLVASDGHVLGTLCVIDGKPRSWSSEQVSLLTDLAASAMTEVRAEALR
jgi:GAF domain-containing protein